jgi:uncharacterized membrane protein YqjE
MDANEPGLEPERPVGVLNALRRMLGTLIALVHTRLELFTTEIAEEIQRAAVILLWSVVALFFGSLTVLMIAVTILIVFWDQNRVLTACLITAAFLAITVATALMARARFKAKPRFMASSIEELQRDREALERGT